jgi:hypothetical protein
MTEENTTSSTTVEGSQPTNDAGQQSVEQPTQDATITLSQKDYDRLNGRLGDALDKLSKFEKIEKDRQEKDLASQGKYEELISAQKKEIEELMGKASKWDEIEKSANDKLENELEELDDELRDLVIKSGLSAYEKIDKARALKEKLTKSAKTSSPASSNGGVATGQNAELFEKIKNDAQAQVSLSISNPDLFKAFRAWVKKE